MFLSNYGGGYVAGDETSLSITCEPGASLFVGQQANGRVYKNPNSKETTMKITGSVAAGSRCIQFAEPLVLHADAQFAQAQEWHISPEASFANIEMISAGRTGRGEIWDFRSLTLSQRIYRNGSLIYSDPLSITPQIASPTAAGAFGEFTYLLNGIFFGEFANLDLLPIFNGHTKGSSAFALTPLACGGIQLRGLAHSRKPLQDAVEAIFNSFEVNNL
ncbi:MAG: urease accessory protein UreD, partial [Fibrobacterales bacterium]